jgi:RNA polymerase sigma-70 factor (ECF subfamily)
MSTVALSDLFRQTLPADVSARIGDDAAHIEDILGEVLKAARVARPSLSVGAEEFVVYLAERLPLEATSIDALRQLRVDDLYLACACARGDSTAISLFDATYIAGLGAVAPRQATITVGEVQQAVRAKLLLGEEGARPKIAEYSGRADLSSWVRVVAVRTALNLARGKRREVPLDEEELLATGAESDNAEIQHLKTLYRGEFRDAFRQALLALSVRDRNMLRQHYVDGVAMERIGAMYQLHRVTIVRRMKDAREELARETRRRLRDKLRVSRGELDSIMRLIGSHLDLSLRLYFREGDDRNGGPPDEG